MDIKTAEDLYRMRAATQGMQANARTANAYLRAGINPNENYGVVRPQASIPDNQAYLEMLLGTASAATIPFGFGAIEKGIAEIPAYLATQEAKPAIVGIMDVARKAKTLALIEKAKRHAAMLKKAAIQNRKTQATESIGELADIIAKNIPENIPQTIAKDTPYVDPFGNVDPTITQETMKRLMDFTKNQKPNPGGSGGFFKGMPEF